ncbi:MAG: NmrA family NAD(P)-binding protein [Pseudomonadota bacterium]
MQRILVLGATGDQGHPLLDRIIAAGLTPVAAVRSTAAFAGTRYADVEKIITDIADERSLTDAAKHVDAIAAHLPFEFDRSKAAQYGANIAVAAKAAQLQKIVFNTSCYVHDTDIDLSAHDGRRDIEAAIIGSGVPYAIFEPKVFMDNIIRSWCKPGIVQRGVYAYPAGPTLKINFICLDDVAAFMVAALQKPEINGRFAIGGPQTLTGFDVADILSEVAGKIITFKSLTPDEFASAMSLLVTGNPEVEPASIYDRMASFYRWYNAQPQSPLVIDPEPVAKQFGVTLTPLATWAARQDWTDPSDPALATRMAGLAAPAG